MTEPDVVIARVKQEEADELFLCAYMLATLCADPDGRRHHLHQRFHIGYGLRGHAGPALVAATQRKLGISDERARLLVDSLQEEARLAEGWMGPTLMGGGQFDASQFEGG